jgi:hypothetical protein
MSNKDDWRYLGPAYGRNCPPTKPTHSGNDKRFMGEVVIAFFLLAMLGMCSAGGG